MTPSPPLRRRWFLVAVFAAALGGASWAQAPLSPPSELALTLLHTNDLHGHMVPFAYVEKGRSPEERPSVGGAARRATLIRKLRAEIPNPVALVDGGDTFTRGPLTNAYEGIADVEAMNAVGYELAVLGNNEFKAKDAAEREDAAGSQSALLKVVKRARFPWLAANVTDGNGSALEGVQPFVVRQWQGVRVGFLGLTAPVSGTYPQTRGWKFADPIETAKAWIPRARAQCDVLIAVTHIGTMADQQLAAQTSGIDAIVGGHSHTFLYQPLEVKNAKDVPVPIVQDGEFGVNLGRFDLRFQRGAGGEWSLAGYKSELLPVGPELAEAPDVAAMIAPYVQPFREVVGRLKQVGATPEERERQTSQLVVDAMHHASGADLALHPLGADLWNAFRKSEVTRFDVFAALPFKDRICLVELTGAEIEKLRAAVKDTLLPTGAPALQPGTTYRVALINFVGRTAYKLPEEKLRDTGIDVRDAVIKELGK